jgi:hypothetical protein
MSPDDDLMRYLDDQFARAHAKLDRILGEMLDHEYEALPPERHRRTQPALARDRGDVGAAPGGAAPKSVRKNSDG